MGEAAGALYFGVVFLRLTTVYMHISNARMNLCLSQLLFQPALPLRRLQGNCKATEVFLCRLFDSDCRKESGRLRYGHI